MRLKAEQLTGQLQQGLLPIYLVYGDEQMLVEETADIIRQFARQQGANERQVWHVEGRFDWSQIAWQEQTMSLFATQRLLEIRLPSGAPGKEGGEAIRQYCQNVAADTTVLIISGKIDTRSQKSKWFTDLEAIGATLAIWPIAASRLPHWVAQRLQQRGLRANTSVANLIAERVEGNLFAAAQEVEKLVLLCPDGQVDEQIVLSAVADNARFQAFDLMDTVYAGQTQKIPRMLARIRAEGIDILAVFSAVSWSLHRMIDMATDLNAGDSLAQVFAAQKPRIWDKSKPLIAQALQRHDVSQWQQFLIAMANIDQAAKGARSQCPWSLLELLCLQVAGMDVMKLAEESAIGY